MADYKQMYLHLLRSTEKALNILIDAQRECEEMYIISSKDKSSPDYEDIKIENHDNN